MEEHDAHGLDCVLCPMVLPKACTYGFERLGRWVTS
jgi:hypothetical protein